MVFQEFRIDRLAALETFVNAMPESNAALTQFPAEADFLAVEPRREIDETDFEILDHTSKFVDALDGIVHTERGRLAAILLLDQSRPIHVHAAGDHEALGNALAFGFCPIILRF